MAVDAGRPRSAGEDRMIQEGVLRAGSGVQGYDSSRGAELASVSESGQLADEEFGRRGSVQQMQEAGRRDSNIQVLFPEGTALLPLSLDGFPCEEKLTLARILPAPQRGKLLEGRTRSLAWTTKTMKAICEAKLLQDAVDSCAGLPRSRFPLFVGRWVGLHFGQSTFGEQQMVDLIESLETQRASKRDLIRFRAQESPPGLEACVTSLIESLDTQRGKSFLMHALHLCCSEQLNAGQTAALLHILDIIDVLACERPPSTEQTSHKAPPRYVSVGSALETALFAMHFASPERKQQTEKEVRQQSVAGTVGGQHDDWVLADHFLQIFIVAYTRASQEKMAEVCAAYQDLLDEMSRGMACGGSPSGVWGGLGSKGRPLASMLLYDEWCDFVMKHFDVDKDTLETYIRYLSSGVVPDDHHKGPWLEKPHRLDLGVLVTLDEALDLIGMKRQWDKMLASDASVSLLIDADGDQEACLMATTPMRLGAASSSKHKLKAAVARIARRTARAQHAGTRPKPHLAAHLAAQLSAPE